jgi:hypothetical protein
MYTLVGFGNDVPWMFVLGVGDLLLKALLTMSTSRQLTGCTQKLCENRCKRTLNAHLIGDAQHRFQLFLASLSGKVCKVLVNVTATMQPSYQALLLWRRLIIFFENRHRQEGHLELGPC